MAVLDRKELEESPLSDLHAIASELGIEGYRRLRREQLIEAILGGGGGDSGAGEERPRPRRRSRGGRGRDRGGRTADGGDGEAADAGGEAEAEAAPERASEPEPEPEPGEVRSGVLDILPNGSGFVRPQPFIHSPEDVYVSPAQIRRCELRSGDDVEGPVRGPRRNERHPSLVRVDKVNGAEP